jgi:hypothetical protein
MSGFDIFGGDAKPPAEFSAGLKYSDLRGPLVASAMRRMQGAA